jgi:hypothetical protein
MIEKMRVMIMLVIIILLGELTTISGSLVFAQTDTTTTSSVRVEGFLALEDLRATLTWGNVTLEKVVERGSTSIGFEIPRPNMRSRIVLEVEPNGLELTLAPTATGYSLLKVSLGNGLKVETLRILVQEVLIVLDLEINVTPVRAIHKLVVDNESIAFSVETKDSWALIRPSSFLIIDPQKTVTMTVEGESFTTILTIRRGLSESDVNVSAEAMGDVKEVVIKTRAAKVLALQEITCPLKLVNVTRSLKDYGPIMVVFAKEETLKIEGGKGSESPTSNQPFSQGGQPGGSSPLLNLATLMRWKALALACGTLALCLAVALGKKWLAILALILLGAYFALTFLGGL